MQRLVFTISLVATMFSCSNSGLPSRQEPIDVFETASYPGGLFRHALVRTGLDSTLTEPGSYIVFEPIPGAFREWLIATSQTDEQFLARDDLRSVMNLYVAPGAVSDSLAAGQTFVTLSGHRLRVVEHMTAVDQQMIVGRKPVIAHIPLFWLDVEGSDAEPDAQLQRRPINRATNGAVVSLLHVLPLPASDVPPARLVEPSAGPIAP